MGGLNEKGTGIVMKRKLMLLTVGIMVLALLVGVDMVQRNREQDTLEEGYAGSGDKVTRAETARLLSLMAFTKEELAAMERVIPYEDTKEDYWYDKYINGAYTMNLLEADHETGGSEFRPMSFYTFEDCQMLIELFCVKIGEKKDGSVYQKLSETLSVIQGDKKGSEDVRPEEFMELYADLYEVFTGKPLEQREMYFLASYEHHEELKAFEAVTNEGKFTGDGLSFDQYVGQTCRTYLKGQEILRITGRSNAECTLPNVWIVRKKDRDIRIFTAGITVRLSLAGTIADDIDGQVADLEVMDGKVTGVSVKPDRISGKILAVTEDYIEIENYGKRTLSQDAKGYKIYGDLSAADRNSLMVGYDNAEFVIAGDSICAILVTKEVVAENIRVLLKTTGFKDYGHASVTITSKDKFIVKNETEEKTYKGGKSVVIKPDSGWLDHGRAIIEGTREGQKITVKSVKRNDRNPSYQGTLEIVKDDEELLLINELSLEQYLYGVVPSEMPASYGVEALKAQAVCARTYAYRQLMENRMKQYGAHVDDSSAFQVYNNTASDKKAKKAVDATRGEVLTTDGGIINAYYFSTSCGHTADASEVWDGASSMSYLKGTLQSVEGDENMDLSKEEDFKAFIDEDTVETYDSESPWYRWKAALTFKNISKQIDAKLAARYEANPALILTKQEDGSFASIPVGTVGNVKSIQIENREQSGIITQLLIEGTKETIRVFTEYNIRVLLAPESSNIIRQDDSKVSGLSMLPSAFFYFKEKEKEGKTVGYTFYGGGYGHGVGLSQNGAKDMIDRGNTYDEVLKHYYSGIEIGKVY